MGEQPDVVTVEALVTNGEGKQFLQKAIAEQGRGTVMNMVVEIQEQHNTVTDLERSLAPTGVYGHGRAGTDVNS